MEEDSENIINQYFDQNNSYKGVLSESASDVSSLDKVKAGASNGGSVATAPMYEVNPPSMADVYKIMTNMQKELEALKRGQGPSNSSTSTMLTTRPTLTTRQLHSISTSEEDDILSDSYDDFSRKSGSKRAKSEKRQLDTPNKQQKKEDGDTPKGRDTVEARPECDDINSELKEFASQYETKKIEPGESVLQKVADLINSMFVGVNEEKIKQIVDNLKMPANIYLDPPRVNPEIWKNVVQPKQILDFKLQNIMTRQSQSAVILTQYVDKLFKELAEVPKEEVEKRQRIKDNALMICDALALLGQNAQEATMSRRHIIQYAIKNEKLRKVLMKVPLANNGVPNSFLFGDDLTQPLKDADEDRKMSYKINPKSVLEKSDYSRKQNSSYYSQKSKNYNQASKTAKYRNSDKYNYHKKEKKENKRPTEKKIDQYKDTTQKKDRY